MVAISQNGRQKLTRLLCYLSVRALHDKLHGGVQMQITQASIIANITVACRGSGQVGQVNFGLTNIFGMHGCRKFRLGGPSFATAKHDVDRFHIYVANILQSPVMENWKFAADAQFLRILGSPPSPPIVLACET